MNQNRLFLLTRTRLALWYAVVMGVILSLSGFGVYRAIAHAHWVAVDRELESVAGTLHDSLELKLKQPGRLEPIVVQLLPDLCVTGDRCFPQPQPGRSNDASCAVSIDSTAPPPRHLLSVISQGNYYLRLLDRSGCLIAVAGQLPESVQFTLTAQQWQILKDASGTRYQQISLLLHTSNQRDWGYMQVGRSLKDFDDYLATVRWILFLGLPITMGLVGVSSWWLAGRAMQPIYQSYRQIQQFTADAAHELRTPLAATQATVESALLMPYLDESEARDILKTIERQNRRLTQLVADLLLLARLERQPMPVRRQPCCLNDIVSDLVEELAALAIASGVTLTSEVRVHKPLNVIGEEEQLYRLVSNLIVNALQYTPSDGQVTVVLDCSDHHALIHIQDMGIGISRQEQMRIFERFYRVNSDRSRASGGSGLGLAIAQAIVQAHQGSIQVQSELGKGSTFTIRLPLGVALHEKKLPL